MLPQLILVVILSVVTGYPDLGTINGKSQTASHARGVPQGHRFINSESSNSRIIPNLSGSESNLVNTYAENDVSGFHSGSGPTKTFYVNVPQENYPIPPPIAAGPPRKHYRIVFIRSPSPPPPQQILPPKVEQKTLIYVLHPRRQPNEQNIVEVPSVQHDPQVYFVQYENEPPTPEDLQNLVKTTLEGDSAVNFNFGGPSGPSVIAGAPSPAQVYPPGSQGNSIHFKRGVPEQKLAQPHIPQTYRPQASEHVPIIAEAPKIKAINERSQSASESQRNRKRPQVIPARVPSSNRRSDEAGSQESKKNLPTNSAPIVPTPDFKAIFGDTFDYDKPFRFGGKLKPKTITKEEKSISDEGRSKN